MIAQYNMERSQRVTKDQILKTLYLLVRHYINKLYRAQVMSYYFLLESNHEVSTGDCH